MPYSRNNEERAEVVVEAIEPLGPGRSVLDLGAADGWLAVRLARAGHHVTAVEGRENEAELGVPDVAGSLDWVRRAFDAFDLAELGTFDVVVALAVLHWFEEPVAALRSLRSMARTLLLVEIPDPEEARGQQGVERFHALHRAVFAEPSAEVLHWSPGWSPDTHRPIVAVRTG